MAHNSLRTVGTAKKIPTTPQTKKAAKGQVRNEAGGYGFKVDGLDRIKRFLILGSEGGGHNVAEKQTLENVTVLKTFIAKADDDGIRALIDLIVDVSVSGRAPKQDPALFALAYTISKLGSERRELTHYAYTHLGDVARTGTTLFKFLAFLTQFQRIGMGAQKAIGRWFDAKSVDAIAYQLVKYRQREGWTPADVLRVSKRVKSSERPELSPLLDWALGKEITELSALPAVVQGYELAKASTSAGQVKNIVREYKLSWEMIPTQFLNEKSVWEALLDVGVPMGALIRQLPRLTQIGIIEPLGGRTQEIVNQLTDQERLIKARIHPVAVLIALKTYAGGRSLRGEGVWKPERRIVDALDKAFYLAFKAVEPTGKRFLWAVDVSGSMGSRFGDLPISSAEAVAALALTTANVEPETAIVGFESTVRDLGISPSMRLDDVLRRTIKNNFGSTDAGAAIRFARQHKLKVDAFIIGTDNDTYAGPRHTHEELAAYRKETGIDAKLIVLATQASRTSIADPNDPLSLDLVGFDTSVPQIIAEFVRGI